MCASPRKGIPSNLNCFANNDGKMDRKLKITFIYSEVLMYIFFMQFYLKYCEYKNAIHFLYLKEF